MSGISPWAKKLTGYKRGPYGQRKYQWARNDPQARAARRNRRFVPRTMGPFRQTESKYFDSFLNGGVVSEAVTWAGSELDPVDPTFSLFTPVEGSDINQRIGRKVAVYKIAIRGVFRTTTLQDQADVENNPAVRLILFIDTQTNGVQAQGEELMASPLMATPAGTFTTFQNLANLGRFRTLRDKTFRGLLVTAGTDGANTLSNAVNDLPFKMTVRFRNPVVVRFNATSGGTIGDIVDNSFHLLGIKSGSEFVTNLSYHCRTYYKDA